MEKEQQAQSDASIKGTLPLDEERTEELARQIQTLVQEDNTEAALELFDGLHPGDQGEVMEELPRQTQQEILAILPPENAAEVLEHLEPEDIAEVFKGMKPAVLAEILDAADTDVTADILRQLPETQAQDVLEGMEDAAEIAPLLKYADDSAGGRMMLEYAVVPDDVTAAGALDILREQGPAVKEIHTVFVVDREERLAGKLSVVRLALANPGTIVRQIMEADIISVSGETDQEECARMMERYNLGQLPVVDEAGKLIGVIVSEDVIDVVEEEATEDMYKLAGIAGERVSGPLRFSLRNRLPWLTVNLITTFLAALVISIFESTIARVVALAVFLPIVAGQGGIGGTQTLTLVVRSMALGELSRRGGWRLLFREIRLGLINGVLLGVLVGLVAYLWRGNYMLGMVLGLAMLGNMVIAGLAGAGTPLLLKRLRIDPAVASAVVVTTCTDVIGFFLFLGLATMLISFLL